MNEHELEAHLEGRFSGEEVQTPVEEEPSTEPAEVVADTSEEPAASEAATEEPEEGEDPVQKYLAKYDGDTEKALRAAVEAQSLLGRQGSELGDVRKELQELKSMLEPEPVEQFPVTDDLVSQVQQAAYDNGAQAAMWALQNQPSLYETAIRTWAEYDPVSATRFDTDRRNEAYQYQMQAQIAPVIAPVIATTNRDKFLQAWGQVKESIAPDLDQHGPALLELAKESPEVIAVLENGDPESRVKVIQSLYWMAKGRASAPLSEAAQAAQQSAAEQAQQLRVAAAVGTQTSGHPAERPSAQEEGMDAFRQAFLEEAVGIGALKPEALND